MNAEVSDVFDRFADNYFQSHCPSPQQLKAFNMIRICRTAKLGGHLDRCNHCGYQRPSYNLCRNRHCPKCQTTAQQKWLNDRRSELLPCGYFHLVFTLPHDINPLVITNKALLLGALFAQVSAVLQLFAKDPKWRLQGQIGFLAVLHPSVANVNGSLSCTLPGACGSVIGQLWIMARREFLFRSQSLAMAFKSRYIKTLRALYENKRFELVGRCADLACQPPLTG
jgi:hypothetical protein